MTVDQTDVVDVISLNKDSGDVTLTIVDHLDWNEQTLEHLWQLQEKINCYLSFVESGELIEKYPKAKGRKIVISLAAKYPPNMQAIKFIERASAIVANAGFTLKLNLSNAELN